MRKGLFLHKISNFFISILLRCTFDFWQTYPGRVCILLALNLCLLKRSNHRRRIETEGKAKVVASVLGQNLFNSLPHKLFCLGLLGRKGWIQPVYLKKTVELNHFFQNDRDKTASATRNLTNFAHQTEATTFALASVPILFLWDKRFSFWLRSNNWHQIDGKGNYRSVQYEIIRLIQTVYLPPIVAKIVLFQWGIQPVNNCLLQKKTQMAKN